ncbi:MAG TPA: hypothetical protein VHT28_05675 [Silvibacterium sp.]|nr:hypothetical protein [Silvibacterium sp.]
MKQNIVIQGPKQRASLVLFLAAATCIGLTPKQTFAADAGLCSKNPQNRQLDYWLGDWTISGPGSSSSATSRVYLTLDDCMVVESWDGGRGHRGENMFAWSADDKSWHGMFADNEGRVHVFLAGKVAVGTAEFTGSSHGADGDVILNRVKIVRLGPNEVEQVWQKSSDNGATWSTEFRGEYSRKTP